LEKQFNKEKKIAALISILSNSSLIILKILAGIISGSIGIISEAIHSCSDLLASFIAYFSISKSSQPADLGHQYGHGKYEDFAGLAEGLLIILAAFYIIFEAVKKIITPNLERIEVNIGLLVMFISVLANIFVSKYLFKIAKKSDSVALYADGEHLRTDVYSSLAVFFGLLFVKITGNIIFDPIIAIAVAIIIFTTGLKICKSSKDNLLDASLSQNEVSQIKEILADFFGNEIIELKSLRTRKAGLKKNIEITLIVNKELKISVAHSLCDKIEERIEDRLNNTDIAIHLEPSV